MAVRRFRYGYLVFMVHQYVSSSRVSLCSPEPVFPESAIKHGVAENSVPAGGKNSFAGGYRRKTFTKPFDLLTAYEGQISQHNAEILIIRQHIQGNGQGT